MDGDQRLRRPVLPGRGELPSQICSECAPHVTPRGSERWGRRSPSQKSLKAAGVTMAECPRRGLEELVPRETVDRKSISS